MSEAALKIQQGGRHYMDLKIQPVEFIMANMMGFCEGCTVKYVTRWRSTGGIGDLRKARHYIQYLLEAPWYMRLFYRIRFQVKFISFGENPISAHTYNQENNIQNPEGGVIRHIYYWNITGRQEDLNAAMKWMDELLDAAMVVAGTGSEGE